MKLLVFLISARKHVQSLVFLQAKKCSLLLDEEQVISHSIVCCCLSIETCAVIGVYKDKIWFSLHGYESASYWNAATQSFCSHLSNDKNDNYLPFKTDEHEENVFMDVSTEACSKYGVRSGQKIVRSGRGDATGMNEVGNLIR